MKKRLFFNFAILIITFSAKAQSTIPNNGFENWTNNGTYQEPNSWSTMNPVTTSAGVFTCTKGSPGNPGSSFLKLTSKTAGNAVVNGMAVSGEIDTITLEPLSGFVFLDRPQSFTGKWQHMIYGTSQGSLTVTLTRWDNGTGQRVIVGTASQTLSGMAMSWSNFSINFSYVDGGYPDSCIIVLKASGQNPANNDYLWVDDLSFSGSVAGIENTSEIPKEIKLYPNPSKSNLIFDLNFNSSQYAVISLNDLNGKIIRQVYSGIIHGKVNKTLDVSGTPPGTYFFTLTTQQGTITEKVFIQ